MVAERSLFIRFSFRVCQSEITEFGSALDTQGRGRNERAMIDRQSSRRLCC